MDRSKGVAPKTPHSIVECSVQWVTTRFFSEEDGCEDPLKIFADSTWEESKAFASQASSNFYGFRAGILSCICLDEGTASSHPFSSSTLSGRGL